MDSILLISIGLVFLTALIGTYLERRRRDRALGGMQGFHVTVERKDLRPVWGRAKVFANGLELVFTRPHKTENLLEKTSFVFYQNQLSAVQAVYRYHEQLSKENQKRRRQLVRQTDRPGPFRRFRRSVQNFLNTFRDAVNESMGMVLLRMKGTSQSAFLNSQDKRLAEIGQKAVGVVGNAYDPILEQYVGRRVVVEQTLRENEKREFGGILKEYSPAWITLLDCRQWVEQSIPISDAERLRLHRSLHFAVALEAHASTPGRVTLRFRMINEGRRPVQVQRFVATEYGRVVDRKVPPGGSLEVVLDDLPGSLLPAIDPARLPIQLDLNGSETTAESRKASSAGSERRRLKAEPDDPESDAVGLLFPQIEVVLESEEEFDVCLPRATSIMQHGGELL